MADHLFGPDQKRRRRRHGEGGRTKGRHPSSAILTKLNRRGKGKKDLTPRILSLAIADLLKGGEKQVSPRGDNLLKVVIRKKGPQPRRTRVGTDRLLVERPEGERGEKKGATLVC